MDHVTYYDVTYILGVSMDIILVPTGLNDSECSQDGDLVHEEVSTETR